MNHTPEHETPDELFDRAIHERMIDCFNACAGIEDPADLRRQRDELLDIVSRIIYDCEETFADTDNMNDEWKAIYSDAKKAIANCGNKR